MIVRRRIDFDFGRADAVPRDWYAGSVHLSTFWGAMSLLFPEGERFFVESVVRFRDRIDDPELRAAIAGFSGQEAMHGRAHRAFNDVLRAHGFDVPRAERQLRRLIDRVRRHLSPRAQLAVTCALEHFTATLAEQLLSLEEHRDAIVDPTVQRLWLWHALEESEHKSVAFDVYLNVGGGYWLRAAIMLVTTVVFLAELMNVHVRFLRAQGELLRLRGWVQLLRHMAWRPGLMRQIVPTYLDYYRPGFHPSQRDTTGLQRAWSERLFPALRPGEAEAG
jgi:predicted metal-dependent hydrolase